MDLGRANVEYDYFRLIKGMTIIGAEEALLRFDFSLEIDTGKISSQVECIIFSDAIRPIVSILKSKPNSEIRKRNQPLMTAFNKLLLARCFQEFYKIGEKEGIQFHNYQGVLERLGIEKVSFKNEDKSVLNLKDDKLTPKKEMND